VGYVGDGLKAGFAAAWAPRDQPIGECGIAEFGMADAGTAEYGTAE
jgi:hypothetical protein